jgi:protein-tyrosine phosphatase
MTDFVDLHCHYLPGVDDGVRSDAEGMELLEGLKAAGFGTVFATPHMRPGLFDNGKQGLERSFDTLKRRVEDYGIAAPSLGLASEHFFDDIVFARILAGEGLPYPGTKNLLVEFPPVAFPIHVQHRLVDLKRRGFGVVLAHPERYEPVWANDECLDIIFDGGARLLLDVCALTGKYGRAPKRAAETLLEQEAYEAACTDAHSPRDVDGVVRAIARLRELVGTAETTRLLSTAPRAIAGVP